MQTREERGKNCYTLNKSRWLTYNVQKGKVSTSKQLVRFERLARGSLHIAHIEIASGNE